MVTILDEQLANNPGDYPVRVARAALRAAALRGWTKCFRGATATGSLARYEGGFDLLHFLRLCESRAQLSEAAYQLSPTTLEKEFGDLFQHREANAVIVQVLLKLLGRYDGGTHHHIVSKSLATAAAKAIVAVGGYEHEDVLSKLIDRDPPNRRNHLFEMLWRAVEYKRAGFDFEVSSNDRDWDYDHRYLTGDYYLLIYRLSRGAMLPSAISGTDKGGWTGLHFLIKEGDKDPAGVLLANRAHVNARDSSGLTPLHVAAARQYGREQVELLLANGADVNAADHRGCTPLHYAVGNKEPEPPVRLLLEKGADVNVGDNDGRTPLHYSMEPSHNRILEVLLRNGANVNARDKNGITPLGDEVRKGGKLGYHADILRQYGGRE